MQSFKKVASQFEEDDITLFSDTDITAVVDEQIRRNKNWRLEDYMRENLKLSPLLKSVMQ